MPNQLNNNVNNPGCQLAYFIAWAKLPPFSKTELSVSDRDSNLVMSHHREGLEPKKADELDSTPGQRVCSVIKMDTQQISG